VGAEDGVRGAARAGAVVPAVGAGRARAG